MPAGFVRRGLTGVATAFVVPLALCQSPVRNLGRGQVQGPCCPTGSPTTPPSLPSCGWLRPTPSSSCASARRAAATTASLAVECRLTRPVRADPPPRTIRTTTATGTTTITPAAKGPNQPGICRRLPGRRVAWLFMTVPNESARSCRGQGRAPRARQGLWPRHAVSRNRELGQPRTRADWGSQLRRAT